MNFFKKKENSGGGRASSFRSLDNILFGGVCILLILLLFLILWDDYIFYKVNYRDITSAGAATYGEAVTAEDISKVIKSMDTRSEKFQDTLNQN